MKKKLMVALFWLLMLLGLGYIAYCEKAGIAAL